jgi:dTDP-4-amino-4,6-dideoxygalactose transaminase
MSTRPEATIPFVDLRAQIRSLEPALTEAIQRTLARADFILGSDVDAFEQEFAHFCGVGHAVGVDSGLSALELTLRALEIGPGDEVITQANTFIATVGAIMAVGARPVLVDCDSDGAIDRQAVAAAVTAKTGAIMPVHLFGRICDIEAVLEVGARHGIPVIEDACQAHGASWHRRRAGSFGIAAAFSFYPAKNLGAMGDGGIITTNSAEIAAKLRILRNYGSQAKYEHVMSPFNRRLDTIQAAVLRVKLPHLDAWNAKRISLAAAYLERLAETGLKTPAAEQGLRHVYHLFVIELEHRDALRSALREQGIETGIHYPIGLHLQPTLRHLGYRSGSFPNTERLAARSLSLPMFPELTLEQVTRVSSAIGELQSGLRRAA